MRYPKQDVRIFVFRSKKLFFDISISGGCTSKRKVLAVPRRYTEQDGCIFVFQTTFSLISRLLGVALLKKVVNGSNAVR